MLAKQRLIPLAKIQQVIQTRLFRQTIKKLKPNQKNDLDKAIRALMTDPLLGEKKRGDLDYLRVHKFKMNKQLTLLGYSYAEDSIVLELLSLGSHENFYRDIKR